MKYKEFKISELFSIHLAKGDLKEEHCIPFSYDTIPLISAGDTNNGLVGHIDSAGDGRAQIFPENVITVDMFCKAYYQPTRFFSVSHGRVNILIPQFELNAYIALYICTVINNERYRFNYGRAVYSKVLGDLSIKLPVQSDGNPHFQYMENYIKALPAMKACLSKIRGCSYDNNAKDPLSLIKPSFLDSGKANVRPYCSEWKIFKIGDLFSIRKGKRLTNEDKSEGSLPFIGAIETNNGVTGYINEEALHSGNVISVNYNGSVGEAFYQPSPFWASDDVNVLYPKGWQLTPAIALYICTVIRKERYRFSYGRKWKLARMVESEIWLPTRKSGTPNWEYMEVYITSLPGGAKLQNL